MKRMILALIFANLAATACLAFNPQPDPPGKYHSNVQNSIQGVINGQRSGSAVMLNPQPLQPAGAPIFNASGK